MKLENEKRINTDSRVAGERTMSDRSDTTVGLFRRGYDVLRQDGVATFCDASLRQFGLSPRGYWYYLQYRWKRLSGRECADEQAVFEPIWVAPESITHEPTTRFDKWRNMGEIRGGDWDRPAGRFADRPLVQTLRERFENDVPWEETDYVQYALGQIEQNETVWNGCRSREDVFDRCAHIDGLYDRIRTEGYRSQPAIHGTDYRSLLLSGSFNRSMTDVAVHIGRDGQLLFVDGNHRLTIAKALDLESIPVRVVIRHRAWEAVRRRVKNEGLEGVPEALRAHPDLVGLTAESS